MQIYLNVTCVSVKIMIFISDNIGLPLAPEPVIIAVSDLPVLWPPCLLVTIADAMKNGVSGRKVLPTES